MAKKRAKKTAKKKATRKKAASKPPVTGLIPDVQKLMDMMVANDVTEIDVEDRNRKIAMKRGGGGISPPAIPASLPATKSAPIPATPDIEEFLPITSPMVGTFYTATDPDSEPFVQPGTTVNNEAVICIVEAMKVMNEIKAECTGTIVEVCAKNAEPVEFGQVLFRVKPG